jgi:hypothetical protein
MRSQHRASNDLLFLCEAAFSGSPGELRYVQDAPRNGTHVQADINGDGIADRTINLTVRNTLTVRDFNL